MAQLFRSAQRWSWDRRDHGGDRQIQNLRLALAGAFMPEGVDGLLRDKSRPPRIAPLDSELVDQVVALTLEPPRQEAMHWTVRTMARAVGIAASSVVKIWHGHGLAQLQTVE